MKQLTDTAINLFSGRIAAFFLCAKTWAVGFLNPVIQNMILKNIALHKIMQNIVGLSSLLIAFCILGVQAQADTQNSISSLSVNSGNGTTVIKIELTQPLANLPAGFTINTPPRIAFDFPNTTNGLGKSARISAKGICAAPILFRLAIVPDSL